jgi:hypothetical protein
MQIAAHTAPRITEVWRSAKARQNMLFGAHRSRYA